MPKSRIQKFSGLDQIDRPAFAKYEYFAGLDYVRAGEGGRIFENPGALTHPMTERAPCHT
jgi:hypothetical protein